MAFGIRFVVGMMLVVALVIGRFYFCQPPAVIVGDSAEFESVEPQAGLSSAESSPSPDPAPAKDSPGAVGAGKAQAKDTTPAGKSEKRLLFHVKQQGRTISINPASFLLLGGTEKPKKLIYTKPPAVILNYLGKRYEMGAFESG